MKTGKQILALLLVVTLSIGILPTSALAMMLEGSSANGLVLTDSDGNTVEVDKSWEETFPYGTFALDNGQLALTEGGEPGVIRVYRLGGTAGKAELTMTLSPVVTQIDEEEYSTVNAAGTKDFTIEVEDSLPIAEYQAYGMSDQPLAPAKPVAIEVMEETADSEDGDGNVLYGNSILSIGVEADSYRWQAYRNDGWEDIEQADSATLDASNEVLALTDIRCIYTIDAVEYGSDSLWGEAYEPFDLGGAEIPDDLERNPEQSFHTLELNEGEYDTYEFYMTFAQGEWMKEIRITPIDDDESESVELVALKIESVLGGTLYDTANTMLISIEDNDAPQPSTFGFQVSEVVADKAAGTARLTVVRTGALQHVVTVDYHTVDGSAKAGRDYAEGTGTLYFSGGIAEMDIEIQLIDDAIPVEQPDRSFDVVLDNPQGGGDQTAIEGDTATVRLYNSGEGGDKNLATLLYSAGADDVSGSTQITAGAIAPTQAETLYASPVIPAEPIEIEVDFSPVESEDGLGTLEYNATDLEGRLEFSNKEFKPGDANNKGYWAPYADLDGMDKKENTNDSQQLAYKYWDDGKVSKAKAYDNSYWAHRRVDGVGGDNGKRNNWNTKNVDNFDQLFKTVYFTYRADTDTNWMNTFYSQVYLGVLNKTNSNGAPSDNQSWNGITQEKRIADGDGRDDVGDIPNWVNTPRSVPFDIYSGAKGIFFSFGLASKSWGDTGEPMAAIWLKARASRRYLEQPLSYIIHTADDDAIKALGATEAAKVFKTIAPEISMAAGTGGAYGDEKVYVGSTFTFGAPGFPTYTYATNNNFRAGAAYLSGKTASGTSLGLINNGSADPTSASLQILGGNGMSFAEGAGRQLSTNDNYSLNVVLNRQQKITIDVEIGRAHV